MPPAMKIKIFEAAGRDLIAGHRFYERQSAGLGDDRRQVDAASWN